MVSIQQAPPMKSVLLKWSKRIVAVLAGAYPLTLLLIILLFRYKGETWWATAVGLYLPRIGFGLPLPFLLVAVLVLRMHKYVLALLLGAWLLVFPLMGMVVSWPSTPEKDQPVLRVLSLNVDSAFFGADKIDAEVVRLSPDIVMFQEMPMEAWRLTDILEPRYPYVISSNQFVMATRFPVREITNPDRIYHYGGQRSPRFMRYLLDTPLGPVAVYNMHPISPRMVFTHLRGRGLTREILSGRIFSGWAAPEVLENNELRAQQVQMVGELAAKETYPVIIAGDTNCPGLSRTFGEYLSRFQDGFAKVGFGWGYTFISYRRWLRLDRILASRQLRFLRFEAACANASDHLCVTAELQRSD
jgi:endonuclease/exonuclease/phosphatase (EEP) superfamily protein YafD